MFKTLKSKFSAIYICLVLLIAIIGLLSTWNNYQFSKQVNSLMVRNYKSINAVNSMKEYLQEQNAAILTYINIDQEQGIKSFHLAQSKFNEYYNIEANNITEQGEDSLVKNLKNSYDQYLTLFSEFQEIHSSRSLEFSANYYNTALLSKFNNIKEILSHISQLNENGMFYSKNKVTTYASKSMHIMLIISLIFVTASFLVSRFSLNRFLQPIYSLRESIRAIKAGNLNLAAPIISKDEIGELTLEFNSMTSRLKSFEESTLGQLLSEKNKSVTIVKSIPDPLIVLDNNYKIILLNNACENIFSIKEYEVLNKYFLETINRGDIYEYIHKVNNSEEGSIEQKIFYINLNDKDYYYNIIVSPLKDNVANSYGIVVLFQNVTQLKYIEKIKSDFISTISHEFKTPLTSIMMGTSLFSNERIGNVTSKQKEIIETIAEDSERLLSLVNNLLNLSKLEDGKAIFNIQAQEVSHIIEESIRLFSEQAKSKAVKLQLKLEPDLPKVNTDFEKTVWVLNNLISNALRYTKKDNEILVEAFVKQNKMCVAVKDSGIGIPAEYKEKIFEKFVQVPDQDSETTGTGLGLAISKEIVEALGGEIWCESKLEIGSTFTFTIPLSDFVKGDLK